MTRTVLSVRDLGVSFRSPAGPVRAVDGLSFDLARGETLALVGESGCGKSATALALMRLLPPGAAASGRVLFEGADLLALPERRMRALRGGRIAMVFQDPMSSLNPVMTIGDQLVEAIRAHAPLDRRRARARAAELLEVVHIPEPGRRLAEHPHRLSGGMRQRVVIAMALAAEPSVLIADEPTTALDVTIQAQILRLLCELQRGFGMAILLITHDLGVVAETAHRVAVMYAGRTVEERPVEALFADPRHPYTRGLMAAMPRLSVEEAGGRAPLREIPGMVPSPAERPKGCAFAPRCGQAVAACHAVAPAFRPLGPAAGVACPVVSAQPLRGAA